MKSGIVATVVGGIITGIITGIIMWRLEPFLKPDEAPKRAYATPTPTPRPEPAPPSQSIPSPAQPPTPSPKTPPPVRVVVVVRGEAASATLQSIRIDIENGLLRQGISVGSSGSRDLTHSVEVVVGQSVVSNESSYGSSTFSADCSGTVHVTDLLRNKVVGATTVSVPKRVVGFSRDQAVSECLSSIRGSLEKFVSSRQIALRTN